MNVKNPNSLYLVGGIEMSQNPIDITGVRELIQKYGFQVKNYLGDTRTAHFIRSQEDGIINISAQSAVIVVPRETIPRELVPFIPKNKYPDTGTLALVYALHERCSKILVVDFPGTTTYAKEYDLPNVMLIPYRATAKAYVSGFNTFLGSK